MSNKKHELIPGFNSSLSKEEMLVKFHEKTVNQILDQMRSLKGFKRITLVVQNGKKSHTQKFFMDESGAFESSVEPIFRLVLSIGLDNGGGVVLRQFLDEKIPFTHEHQQKIYGLMLREGGYSPLIPSKIQEMHERDSKTGEVIPTEDGVSYGNWETLLPKDILDEFRGSNKESTF